MIGFFLLQVAGTPPPDRPIVRPPRVDTSIVVDGDLDEPAWVSAAVVGGFHQYRPLDQQPAEQATTVRVWYSPTAIYFGIVAHDRNPGSIRATLADRDKIEDDDRVQIFLDTFNDRRRAFVFGVNPLGVQEDGVRSEGNSGGGGGGRGGGGGGGGTGLDRSPNYLFESKGHVTDSGYVVEVRIPFKSLRYPAGRDLTWGFNVVRSTPRSGFEDSWTDARRGNTSFLSQAGFLSGLSGIKRGVVTEVQPFVTAAASGAIDTTASRFVRESLNPDFGVNFRIGFSSLAVDGTINPDFSQVESDAGQVTLNERFALFFPERRPFFLEGIELFQTPGSIVYTRRIANPVAGGKVTGKFRRIGIAHLLAVDEQTDETTGEKTHPFVSVTRIRTDIGANSLAGATLTNRSISGGFSRTVAADSRFALGKLYAFSTSVANSWHQDSAGSLSAPAWSVGFDRTGRSVGFSYSFEGRDPGFEAALGFVPRVGDVNLRAFNRLTIFGKRGAFFEGITLFAGASRYWDYRRFGEDQPTEGDQSLSGFGRIRGGWSYGFSTRLGFVDFNPDFYEGTQERINGQLTPYRGPARLEKAVELSISASTPKLPQGSGNIRVNRREVGIFSEASEGREFQFSAEAELRPHRWVRVEGTWVYSKLTRARDGSEFGRTMIPRLRLEFQPNRTYFLRVISEYRSQRRAEHRNAVTGNLLYVDGAPSEATNTNRFRVDVLLSFQPSQGTVAFLGYGAGYDGERNLTLRDLVKQEDGFFFKLAYQFRH